MPVAISDRRIAGVMILVIGTSSGGGAESPQISASPLGCSCRGSKINCGGASDFDKLSTEVFVDDILALRTLTRLDTHTSGRGPVLPQYCRSSCA